MNKLEIEPLALAGAAIVRSLPFRDDRGAFARFFCERELQPIIGGRRIVNVNFSRTMTEGAVRGLHFQHPPHAEMKLVRCLSGRVFDVIVDLRAGSPTFLQWVGVELDPDRFAMMVVPEGFAHGFQVLSAPAELLYLHTEHYCAEAEGGLRATDPRLHIDWPRDITQMSDRDRAFPLLTDTFDGIDV